MSEAESQNIPSVLFSFPAWINKIFQGLQTMILCLPWIVICIVGLKICQHGPWWTFPVLWIGVIFIVLQGVVIHEFGHFIGAILGGMTPYGMQIATFDIKIEKRSWRLRWRKPQLSASGYVLVHPNVDKPFRKQHLILFVCGPLANLLSAVVFGIVFTKVESDLSRWFFLGLTSLNLSLGLANLLPTEKGMASDGLNLIRWWRGMDDDLPELVWYRLNGLSIKGITADKLPAEKLALLEHAAFPMPLIHTWWMLKLRQIRAEWDQAAAIETVLEQQVATLTPDQINVAKDLLALMRCEILFSKSLLKNKADDTIEFELTHALDWLVPFFRPRCRALQAALQGEAEAAQRFLDDSEAKAAGSLDRASVISEEMMRNTIRGVILFNSPV